MKKISISILIITFSLTSFGQMKSNGKLLDIRNATKQQVMGSMAGEFGKDYGDEEYSIKIDKLGNFKMYYARTIRSKSFNQGDGGWTLRLSGKVSLILADETRKETRKDKYGDVIGTYLFYTKYYAVFTGTDDKGRDHSFCAKIYQKFDDNYMYGWQMGSTNKVPGSYCESTNDPQTVEIGYIIDLN
jgi:hypothetical protein